MDNGKNFLGKVQDYAPMHYCSEKDCTTRKKAAIYFRCAQDAACLDIQARLKTLVEKQKTLQFAGVYADVGYSGYNTNRPALGKLIKECEAGNVNVIVVDWAKSLSRKIEDYERLFDVFRQKSVLVYQCGNETFEPILCESMLEMTLKRSLVK